MQSVPWLHAPKQESVSLLTRTEIATLVIPGSGLALQADMMTLTHVETSLNVMQIMVINSLKLSGTFWYSERHPAKNYLLIIRYILLQIWALSVHYYTDLKLYVKTWFHIAAWLKKKKTFRQIGLLRVKQAFSIKNISKEANIKTKQCNLCFFSLRSLFFQLPLPSFAWFFSSSGAKTCLLALFYLNGCKFRSICFLKIGLIYCSLSLPRGAQKWLALRPIYE